MLIRTVDAVLNPTESTMGHTTSQPRGMVTGTGTTAKAIFHTHGGCTELHQMGLLPGRVVIPILENPARSGMEPDLIMEIKPQVDINTDPKTMGHIMGYGTNATKNFTPEVRTNNNSSIQQSTHR